jgi:predicted regulator of Ras-like GTPase activity (Roadblock/LC7/MglB family)
MSADAIRAWSDELARDPNSLAFLRLAEALRRRRELDEARAVALRGLSRHPYLADAHDVLARVHVDAGEPERAREEWEMAVRIDPRHLPSLKGLGFLAFRRHDFIHAERYLREALVLDPRDSGLAQAHQRLLDTLAPRDEPAPAAPNDPPASGSARELFAPLLGDGDRTALLLDRDGLVVAGAYVDAQGRNAGDEVGAELSGVSEEAGHALEHLGLGEWIALLVEAQHATVGLAPALDGGVVLVAAARDTHVGFVRRLLMQARDRANAWLEGAS